MKTQIPAAVWAAVEEAYTVYGLQSAHRLMLESGYPLSADTVSAHCRRRNLKAGSAEIDPVKTEVPSRREEELRRALAHTQKQLAIAKARTDELVSATITACKEATLALGPIAPVIPPEPDKRKRHEEVALWHLTDWQGSKVTTSYNSTVMQERVMRFCQKARDITDVQRADHPVRSCVIAFGGDMIEGLFNYPTQSWEVDSTLFQQYVNVARLIGDVVRFALSVYENVEVIAEWGNHGRIGSKRDSVPRSDNVDRMCYELARQLMESDKRLVWKDCPDDIQRIEVGNYRAILIHGDEIGRNGFASPSTIVQHVNRWRSGAYKWKFRDCYLGHYHTHNEWTLANGEGSVYQTGSTESDNRYAGVMLAASAIPSQRLHFIDPVKGRVTASYKVWLED